MNLKDAIQIVPLSVWHVLTCPEAVPTGYQPIEYAQCVTRHPYAYTALLDNVPVILAGVLPLWKGVGEAWTYIKDDAKRKPMWLHRTVKRMLEEICMEHNFHRIQANCIPSSKEIKWLETLGFKNEGIMKMYSPDGNDMVRMARTFNK